MKNLALASGLVASLIGGAVFAQQGGPPAPPATPAHARPLAERITHYNPATNRQAASVHAGAGPMAFGSMLGNEHTDTNLWFLHRGNIPPKGGIGAHFHNNCEEMFVILNGEAQFTVDGRTSILEGPGRRARSNGSFARDLQSHRSDDRVDEHQRDGDQGLV